MPHLPVLGILLNRALQGQEESVVPFVVTVHTMLRSDTVIKQLCRRCRGETTLMNNHRENMS